MHHDEMVRAPVLLEGYIEKYKSRTSQYARKWFKFENALLSYSLRERLDVKFT